jgi:hypothetical protein
MNHTQVKMTDLSDNNTFGGLEGISFKVAADAVPAITNPAVPALDFSNVIGLTGSAQGGKYVVDDLKLGRFSPAEQAAVCELLQQLRCAVGVSSVLARDIVSYVQPAAPAWAAN